MVTVTATTSVGSSSSKIVTSRTAGGAAARNSSINMTGFDSEPTKDYNSSERYKFRVPKDMFLNTNGKIEHYVVFVAGESSMENSSTEGIGRYDQEEFQKWNASDPTKMYRASPENWNPYSGPTINTYFSMSDWWYGANSDNSLPCVLNSTDGGDPVCTLGTQDNCTDQTYCNRKLSPSTEYVLKIRAYTNGGWSDSNLLSFKTADVKEDVSGKGGHKPSSNSVGAVVGGIVGALCVLALLAFMFRSKILSTLANLRTRTTTPSPPKIEDCDAPDVENVGMTEINTKVSVDQFSKRISELHADSDLLISKEFEDLKKASPEYPMDVAVQPENKGKNRFINILPFDSTRVKLRENPENGQTYYINASYIQKEGSKPDFIASQGPIPATISDFWRMIWENKVTMIVMLTQCMERGKKKCEKYWPDSGKNEKHGEIEVAMISEGTLPSYVIRIFEVNIGSQSRIVKQMFFTQWPDFKVPEHPELLVNFVNAVRDNLPKENEGPILAHCSAGVGRTGTYIAVDQIMRQIQTGHLYVDVFKTVLDLRNCRILMVQTEDQYVFIYDCVQVILNEELQRRRTTDLETTQIYTNLQDFS